MMRHHALEWCDAWLLRWLYSKRDIIMDFFHLSKNIWARMKVQVFRGRNQNSQQYRVQHQDRIECSLNDGFKGFSDKHQGLAITGKKKHNASAKTDSRQGSRVWLELEAKINDKVQTRSNPLDLQKIFSTKFRLADYIGPTTTTQNLGRHLGKNNTF